MTHPEWSVWDAGELLYFFNAGVVTKLLPVSTGSLCSCNMRHAKPVGSMYINFAIPVADTSMPILRRDVASCGRIIWEGYMGAQEPAFLMRSTVNLEQTGSPRHEHLSTGLYTLMDVICSGCQSPMGWQYLQASHEVSTRAEHTS